MFVVLVPVGSGLSTLKVAVTEPEPFPCDSSTLLRHPRQTKGEDYGLTTEAGACCEPEAC